MPRRRRRAYLARLIELELLDREARMIDRRIKAAKFPAIKSLETFDFDAIPALNRKLVLDLPPRPEPFPTLQLTLRKPAIAREPSEFRGLSGLQRHWLDFAAPKWLVFPAPLTLEPCLQRLRRHRRPLLRELEQAHGSAVAHLVNRTADVGA